MLTISGKSKRRREGVGKFVSGFVAEVLYPNKRLGNYSFKITIIYISPPEYQD
jgi:hypothetical protein